VGREVAVIAPTRATTTAVLDAGGGKLSLRGSPRRGREHSHRLGFDIPGAAAIAAVSYRIVHEIVPA